LKRELTMKICVPTHDENGLDAEVYDHFGSAPFFTVVEVESGEVDVIRNGGPEGRQHGGCAPLEQLSGHSIDAMVCQGIGRGAILRLEERGIQVLLAGPAPGSRVRDVIAAARDGRLRNASPLDACQGGGHGGGRCGH
jgi:predicted Fe-Mo cluster-binding NifX family protein